MKKALLGILFSLCILIQPSWADELPEGIFEDEVAYEQLKFSQCVAIECKVNLLRNISNIENTAEADFVLDSICLKITDTYRVFDCVQIFANKINDPIFCNKIKNDDLKKQCLTPDKNIYLEAVSQQTSKIEARNKAFERNAFIITEALLTLGLIFVLLRKRIRLRWKMGYIGIFTIFPLSLAGIFQSMEYVVEPFVDIILILHQPAMLLAPLFLVDAFVIFVGGLTYYVIGIFIEKLLEKRK